MKKSSRDYFPLTAKVFLVACLLFLIPHGAHALTFSAASNYTAGSSSYGGTSGDLNGDGIQDIVVANQSGTGVSVLIGNGNGTFAAAVLYTTSNHPTAILIADFNNDSKQDVATINNGNNTYSILLGNGDGTLGAASTHAIGSGPFWAVATDLNNDGKIDIATANQFGINNVSVILGNGDGTFGSETTYAAGTGAISIVAADLNNDGKQDLVVSNITSNNVSVLLGNGDGTFATRVNYTDGGTSAIAAAIGDFNGDSKQDLIIVNTGSDNISILLGTGPGTFGSAAAFFTGAGSSPESVTTGDFNGDGFLDLATANNGNNKMGVLLGNGDGTFGTVTQYTTGSGPQVVFSADFNGDFHADLATVNTTDGNVSVFLNQYTFPLHHFSFSAITTQTATVAFPVTITAKDITNQTVPGYTGTVDFSTTAGTASPSTSSSFVSGVLTAQSVSLSGTGTGQTITVTDHGGTKTGVSSAFTVLPIATVSSVTSTVSNGSYKEGSLIPIQIVFNTPVTVTGVPALLLTTGSSTTALPYTAGSGTNTLTFNYTVLAGDDTPILEYSSTNALSALHSSIRNGASYDAVRTLPTLGAAGSLEITKQIEIDTTVPIVSEAAAVSAVTYTSNPSFSYNSNEAGSTTYGGSCSSTNSVASVGTNAIFFSGLSVGDHSDCTITVTDRAGNASAPAHVTPFIVLAHGGHPVTPAPADAPRATASQSFVFKNVLNLGDRRSDVINLQKYLNAHGFIVAKSGPGAPGNETAFFGAGTKRALISFQESHASDILRPLGLTKGTGKLGAATMLYMNAHQ